MNANELADNQLTHVIGENNNGKEVVITLRKPLYLESFVRQQQAEIEELKAKLQLHEAMDNQCASLMQQFRKAKEK